MISMRMLARTGIPRLTILRNTTDILCVFIHFTRFVDSLIRCLQADKKVHPNAKGDTDVMVGHRLSKRQIRKALEGGCSSLKSRVNEDGSGPGLPLSRVGSRSSCALAGASALTCAFPTIS